MVSSTFLKSFNLVIEFLLISRAACTAGGTDPRDPSFNLVIEFLLISRRVAIRRGVGSRRRFQSRNRVSSDFKEKPPQQPKCSVQVSIS